VEKDKEAGHERGGWTKSRETEKVEDDPGGKLKEMQEWTDRDGDAFQKLTHDSGNDNKKKNNNN
jgi:hypothetical protein